MGTEAGRSVHSERQWMMKTARITGEIHPGVKLIPSGIARYPQMRGQNCFTSNNFAKQGGTASKIVPVNRCFLFFRRTYD